MRTQVKIQNIALNKLPQKKTNCLEYKWVLKN